ncbi:MAG: hypothetical protein AAF404_15055 [Pseudomonadota bacterium]
MFKVVGIGAVAVIKRPSRTQCFICHTDNAGVTLGVDTAQLDKNIFYASTGSEANQLTTLSDLGMLSE